MAKQKVMDAFANRAFVQVTMSALDTLTFEQIRFGVGLFQGVALHLCRVEFFPDPTSLANMVAAADTMELALTLRDDLADLDPSNQSIIALKKCYCQGNSTEISELPWTADFSELPEGGLLIPANPLYIAMNSSGFGGAGSCRAIIYYRFKELSDRESIELLQTILPGNV